ncbi:MAG: nucleotidyltransferase domain-containing protein, partial [Gemmatimonadota bacterium]
MNTSDRDSVAAPATHSPSPVTRWAREKAGCRLVVLFGSEPKGRVREGSDLDLAVLFDPLPGPEDRLRIIGELQDLAAPRVADVVFLRPETDPALRFEIL